MWIDDLRKSVGILWFQPDGQRYSLFAHCDEMYFSNQDPLYPSHRV